MIGALGWDKLIDALPVAGTNPFTFISYALLLAVLILYFYRSSLSKERLATLKALPSKERAAFAQKIGWEDILALPENERMPYIKARNRLIVIIVAIIAMLLFFVIWITQAKKLDAEKASAYLRQGISYEDNSDYRRALEAYQIAYAFDPTNYIAARVARCKVALGPPEDAKRYVEESIRQRFTLPREAPEKADLLRLHAVLSRRDKKEADAMSDLDQAEKLIEGMLEAYPTSVRAMIFNQRGNILASGGDYKGAIALFQRAIAEDRRIFDSRAIVKDTSNLASAYNRFGDADTAFKLLSDGIAGFRGTTENAWLGALLWKRGRINEDRWPEQARIDYKEAVSTLSMLSQPDYNTLAKCRGDYAQFLLQKDGDPLSAFSQAVLALQDSFHTGDAHAVLAQTDGIFQVFGALNDRKGEVASGIAALRLALFYSEVGELKELSDRIESRGIVNAATSTGLDANNMLDGICSALFQRCGVAGDKWKRYIAPFTLAHVSQK